MTRPPGVILLFPLALFYLRQRTRGCGRRLSWDALWLLLVPAGLGTFLAYCARLTGDPWAYFRVGRVFGRGISDPISATVRAFGAASDGLAGIIRTVGGSGGYSSFWIADLAGLIVLVAAVAVLVGALRNLPLPYGVYCLASLIVILCTGPVRHPLVPATRYVAVLFPLFIELGRAAGARRNLGAAITVALALVLVVATGAYAHWVFLG